MFEVWLISDGTARRFAICDTRADADLIAATLFHATFTYCSFEIREAAMGLSIEHGAGT